MQYNMLMLTVACTSRVLCYISKKLNLFVSNSAEKYDSPVVEGQTTPSGSVILIKTQAKMKNIEYAVVEVVVFFSKFFPEQVLL